MATALFEARPQPQPVYCHDYGFDALRQFMVYLFTLAFFLLTTIADCREIGPGEDYCREINDPKASNELVLKSGRYQNACKIRRGGAPQAPLTIRAADPANSPTIDYQGTASNVF